MEKKNLDLKKLKNRLLWYLSRRDHSVFELRQKLSLTAEFSESDFTQALGWLKQYGYLSNESQMATRLVEKLRHEGRGKNYITGKLRQKGLKATHEELSNQEAEREAAQVFLDKKLRGRPAKDLGFEELQVLRRKMTTRGFSFEIVRELLP